MSQIQFSKTTLRFGWISLEDIVGILDKQKKKFPDLIYTASQVSGLVSIDLNASRLEDLALVEKELKEQFAFFLFESKEESLAEAIQTLCVLQNKKLSLAESCTGGLLASRFVLIPGASGYFTASLVAYSEEMKQKLLGVSSITLQNFGAVSQEVVDEMVSGLLRITGSDIGIAISGFAGPLGGSNTAPVGTIWISMMQCLHKPQAICLFFRGSRESILQRVVDKVLFALWHTLSFETPFSLWGMVQL